MNKLAFHITLAFLIFSVLAPSFAPLVLQNSDEITVVDTSEEEKKETEKKYDEKNLFFDALDSTNGLEKFSSSSLVNGFLLLPSAFSAEVILPPPKYIP